jgi:two-component system response regulator HydG
MNSDRKTSILIVDDDSAHRATLRTILGSLNYLVDEADNGRNAVAKVREGPSDLILMDVRMTVMNGIEALKQIKQYNPAIPVLIMTAYSSVESAVEALKSGAYDYLTKPLDFEALKITIERALEHTRLKVENAILKKQIHSAFKSEEIIGNSPPMKELTDMLAVVAPSEATVLITGGSGTGKELIARAIHFNSDRREGPLVVVNCAALAETLLESELFGHERGAFTGADKRREGCFMHSNKGTIFLDEIGEMSPMMQAKLLRVIQDRKIQKVGSDKLLQVDVRIVAATNRDLEEDVSSGKFREDLYYRLNVVRLVVPSLKDRLEDIPLIAQYFLDKYAEKNRKQVKGFTPLAMDMLLKYEWPGNVRELENAVERAVILVSVDYVSEKELPLTIVQAYIKASGATGLDSNVNYIQSLEDIEKAAILAALNAAGGNKSEAARKLKITRRTLYKKLHKIGVL